MEKSRLQTWLDIAVSGIRFAPDRKKVEEELRAHLEDKVCELQQFYHLDQDAAEARALELMGSAEDIRQDMARIHDKPWLGWLWLVTQFLVVGILSLCVLMVWEHGTMFLAGEISPNETVAERMRDPLYWFRFQERVEVEVTFLEVPEVEIGQYEIVPVAGEVWQYNPNGEGGYHIAYIELEVRFDRPWEQPYYVFRRLEAEDDCGNTYAASDEKYVAAEETLVPWQSQIDRVEVYTGESGSNFVRYQCFVHEVSRDATELRLYCDFLGNELSIPTKLEGRSETWVKS